MNEIIVLSDVIIFLNKVEFINKALVKNNKNATDSAGKLLDKYTYNIKFHYTGGDVSDLAFRSMAERDEVFEKLKSELRSNTSDNLLRLFTDRNYESMLKVRKELTNEEK